MLQKVTRLSAQRTNSNAPTTSVYPPILPSELVKLSPRQFNQILRSQRERALATHSPEWIVKVEDDFKSFKKHVAHSSVAQEALKVEVEEQRQQCSLFTQAWDIFKGRFNSLFEFCGGLSTVFPGTATVESDFSVLQWEKTPSRNGLSDLSLEGILQCKQYTRLNSLH